MRAVAGKDHAAMDEALEARALEDIDAGPDELEARAVAEHPLEPRHDALGLALRHRVGIDAELEVDTEDVAGLAVHQRRITRMEGRVEPEAPLLAEIDVGAHVGDEETLVEDAADAGEAEQAPQRAARPVGGDHPRRAKTPRAIGRPDRERHMVGGLRQPGDAVAPGDTGMADRGEALDQRRLEFVLRQVDERGMAVAGLRLQIETKQLLVALEHPPGLPGKAALDQLPPETEPAQDLQAASRPADRPAADCRPVALVEQDHVADTAEHEVERHRQPDRAGTDDNNWRARSGGCRRLRHASPLGELCGSRRALRLPIQISSLPGRCRSQARGEAPRRSGQH